MRFTVCYWVHSNPTLPGSTITFKIKLVCDSVSQQGSFVGWRISTLELRKPLAGGGENVWIASNPSIPSPDGLWWIQHASAANPVRAEFAYPPHLTGVALVSSGANDLSYDFRGAGAWHNLPWTVTGVLTFFFQRIATPTPPPEENGDDEDIEIPDSGNDPG